MKMIVARLSFLSHILPLKIFSLLQKGGLAVCLLAIAFIPFDAQAETVKLENSQKTTKQETKKSTVAEWKNPRLVYTIDILTDAEKGEDFYKNIPMYFGKPYPLAISPDGKKLASGGVNTIRLWDLQTGKEIGEPLFSAQGIKPLGISSISFSSDGKILNVFSTGNEILESSNSNNSDLAPFLVCLIGYRFENNFKPITSSNVGMSLDVSLQFQPKHGR
jgi:WD40 repeat protein